MPTVVNVMGFRLFFYSNENTEPIHVHVMKGEANAKWWMEPDIIEEYSYGFTTKERRKIKSIIGANQELIIEKWNEHFG